MAGLRTGGVEHGGVGSRLRQHPRQLPRGAAVGTDKAQQFTLISEHATAAEAFAEIDRLAAQMVRTGRSLRP